MDILLVIAMRTETVHNPTHYTKVSTDEDSDFGPTIKLDETFTNGLMIDNRPFDITKVFYDINEEHHVMYLEPLSPKWYEVLTGSLSWELVEI